MTSFTATMFRSDSSTSTCVQSDYDCNKRIGMKLPLHVQLQALPIPCENSNHHYCQDGNCEASYDNMSACTNPHLKTLMNRYFPSDDESASFDADVESEADERSRRRKVPRNRHRVRRRSTDQQMYTQEDPPANGGSNSSSTLDKKTRHTSRRRSKSILADLADESDKNDPPIRMVSSTYNAWDSSPSTICDREHSSSGLIDMAFDPDERAGSDDIIDGNVKKNLFTEDEGEISDDTEKNLNQTQSKDVEVTDESDLELTQRSRQLQFELRMQELSELAVEAERAADAGKDTFVGNATRFELGRGLDVGNGDFIENPEKSIGFPAWSLWDQLNCDRRDYDAVTPLKGERISFESRPQGSFPMTEVKRPRKISHQSRQSSAPPKLQTRSLILPSAPFLPLAPTQEAKEKISVLALRHMEEVVPPFKEMHSFMKINLSRAGVKNDVLGLDSPQDGQASEVKRTVKDEEPKPGTASRRGSLASSVPFMQRVPSFHMLMKTMSGLSSSEVAASEKGIKSDDEISYGEKIEDDADLSVGPDDIALDCVSFVSCGDLDEDKILLMTPERKSICAVNRKVESRSLRQVNIYVCTLATELHDPRQNKKRSVSPPPKAPDGYGSDGGTLQLTPIRTSITPRSRWSISTLWDNISPAKRAISMPSPLRMQMKRSSWGFSTEPEILKPTPNLRRSCSETLYLHPLANSTGVDGPWEMQKDEEGDGVIISSQSFSETIPRPQSPQWFEGAQESYDGAKDNNRLECTTDESKRLASPHEDKKVSDTDQNISSGKSSKGSCRTSATLISGDGSQSTMYSKFSQSSQPSYCNSVKSNPSDPPLLTIRPVDDNLNESGRPSLPPLPTLDPSSVSATPSEQDSLPDKPPLHPAAVVKLPNVGNNNRKYQNSQCFMNTEKQFLPTIEASISCPDMSEDASSDLSIISDHCADNMGVSVHSHASELFANVPDEHGLTKREASLKTVYDIWKNNEKDEERSLSENASSAFNKPRTHSSKPSFDFIEMESVVSAEDDENNKSMSFIELIEKVPSVINRFRPFRKAEKTESLYQDDTAFIENYFFTGVKVKNGKKGKKSKGHVQVNDKPEEKQFCGRDPCLGFGYETVMESALICLSAQSSGESVNKKNDSSFGSKPERYGNLDNCGRKHNLNVGDRSFKAPSLKVSMHSYLDDSNDQSNDSGSLAGLNVNRSFSSQ